MNQHQRVRIIYFSLWPNKKEFKPNKANAEICQIWSWVQGVWNVCLPFYGFQVVRVKLRVQLSAGNHLRIKPCKCIYNLPVFTVKSLECPPLIWAKGSIFTMACHFGYFRLTIPLSYLRINEITTQLVFLFQEAKGRLSAPVDPSRAPRAWVLMTFSGLTSPLPPSP